MASGRAQAEAGNVRVGALASALLLAGCIPGGVSSSGMNAEIAEVPQASGATSATTAVIGAESAVWDSNRVSANAAPVAAGFYVVQPGDTLRGIGNRTGAGSEAIAAVNGIAAPFTIRPGQRLTIPGGRYHAVAQGETGIAIARAYGVRWAEIVSLNGLEEPYILRIGQRLKLPDAAAATTMAAATTPAPPAAQADQSRISALVVDIDDVVTGSQPAIAEGSAVPPARAQRATLAASAPIAVPGSFSGRFLWPISGSLLTRFGPVGKGQVNNGIDISAEKGAPFRAAADGVVSYAGSEIAIYGGLVLVSHGGGWVSAYGHAERIDVVRGQAVKAGQVLGAAGQSGFSDTPKLHFELRKDRKPVDPLLHLPRG